jgi:aquaporin NIP
MLVIMAVATDRRVPVPVPGVAVGLTVVLLVLIGGPVTGGSMNPARSFGPSLFRPEALPYLWLYAAGPYLGAALGARVYELLRREPEHAKGAPDDI